MVERLSLGIPKFSLQESKIGLGSLEVLGLIKDDRRACDGTKHQAVPRGKNLVVEVRPYAPGTLVEHLLLGGVEQRAFVIGQLRRDDAEDILVFKRFGIAVILKIAMLSQAVVALGQHELRLCEQGLQLCLRPAVEFTLLALAVGILGGVEAAVLVSHVAEDVAQDVVCDVGVFFVAADEMGVEVEVQQLGIIVEHLLEMRHKPLGINGVPCEAAADLVVHAAGRHLVAGVKHHVDGVLVAGAMRVAQQHQRLARPGKFRCITKAAVARVVLGLEPLHRLVQPRRVELDPLPRLERHTLADPLTDVGGGLDDLLALGFPCLADLGEHVGKTGSAKLGHRRIVRAAIERLKFRGQPDVERPTAAAGGRLHEGHVNLIDVRPLLAVEFDADKMLVHHLRRRLVLERLALHHMAPVAGRVADAQQDRLFLRLGLVERLLSPRIPVNRVVLMLLQVRGCLLGQAVGVLVFCGFRWLGFGGFSHGRGGGGLGFSGGLRVLNRVWLAAGLSGGSQSKTERERILAEPFHGARLYSRCLGPQSRNRSASLAKRSRYTSAIC